MYAGYEICMSVIIPHMHPHDGKVHTCMSDKWGGRVGMRIIIMTYNNYTT